MTALIQANKDSFQHLYPNASPLLNSGVLLTNVTSEAEWLARGRVSLAINPGPGKVRLEICRIEEVIPSPTELLWASLRALAHDSRVNFVNTNVQQGWGRERKLYSLHCSAFPHREFLGWMGYVSRRLTADQIPEAARMEHAGEGTLIMATENLDLFDASAVEQANRVEIRLAELGLLPVTDSRLL
ncbi:Imm52 family immunity protein [Stenotrophomonas nematodicola]|nr:Imm52 family immunity protein [Stenotrophomonas nematodicola]